MTTTTTSAGILTGEIAREFAETRRATLELFDLVRDDESLRASPGFGFRPVVWHLAHVGVFEAYWLLQKLRGEGAPDERYERVFDPIKTPREDSKDLPTRAEMEAYLARVREGVWRCLENVNLDEDHENPLLRGGYVFRLVLEHERQHQETLAYLLQMLDPEKKKRPASFGDASVVAGNFESASRAVQTSELTSSLSPGGGMVTVPAGVCEVGSVWDAFAYDNELPAHEVFVPEFKIDRLLTTNAEYARFVDEGGYARREFWSDEGWAWREKEGWECPLYWRRGADGGNDGNGRAGRGFVVRTMFEESAMRARHPVVGVSWYEAEAYARFVGKRLPTEAEWEMAASSCGGGAKETRKRRFAWGDDAPSKDVCNFGMNFWGTTPVGSFPTGASLVGCLDMTGNVWEWTADEFRGFDNFEPFPYPEYSAEWFDGDHRILKGGSWATSPSVLRTSFRNFFRRHFRIAFAGLRCASSS